MFALHVSLGSVRTEYSVFQSIRSILENSATCFWVLSLAESGGSRLALALALAGLRWSCCRGAEEAGRSFFGLLDFPFISSMLRYKMCCSLVKSHL